PGEAPAQPIPPVYLNENRSGGLNFYVFPGVKDTPMNFGNGQAITYVPATGGTVGLAVLFTVSGSFVGTTTVANYAAVGNSNLVNASIFLGKTGDIRTARAVTVMGGTGRVRSFYWDGKNWDE